MATTHTISVPEVHCGHCVSSIEGALRPLDGVVTATVHLDRRAVVVTADDAVARDTIVAVIEDQGYTVPGEGEDVDRPGTLPLA